MYRVRTKRLRADGEFIRPWDPQPYENLEDAKLACWTEVQGTPAVAEAWAVDDNGRMVHKLTKRDLHLKPPVHKEPPMKVVNDQLAEQLEGFTAKRKYRPRTDYNTMDELAKAHPELLVRDGGYGGTLT